jgi:hypothetical protein
MLKSSFQLYIRVEAPAGTEFVLKTTATSFCTAATPSPTAGIAPPTSKSKWLLLLYLAADNDLEEFSLEDVREAASAMTNTQDVKLVVLFDRGNRDPEAYTGPILNLKNFHRTDEVLVSKDFLKSTGRITQEVDTASSTVLADFIAHNVKSYPAERVGLIMWNHGASWTAFGHDADPEPVTYMLHSDMEEGISKGLQLAGLAQLDLLGFDACLMASIEMVALLQPYAKVYLASEDLEPGHGWNYKMLTHLNRDASMSASALADKLLEGFFAHGFQTPLTLTIVDNTKVPAFVSAIESLGGALRTAMNDKRVVAAIKSTGQSTYRMGDEFIDFGHFCSLLKQDSRISSLTSVTSAIDAALASMRDCIIKEQHSYDVSDASGFNFFQVNDEFDYDWRKRDFLNLKVLKKWQSMIDGTFAAVKSGVTVSRSRSVGSVGVGPNPPSFGTTRPELTVSSNEISISQRIDDLSLVMSTRLKVGVKYEEQTWWLGELPATEIPASGTLTATWPRKVLTLSFDGVSCVATSYKKYPGADTLKFHVLFQHASGAEKERAFGVLSLKSGSWTLFRRRPTGISEISRAGSGAQMTILVENQDGELVPSPSCPTSIPYAESSRRRRLTDVLTVAYVPHEFHGLTTALQLHVTNIYDQTATSTAYKKSMVNDQSANPFTWTSTKRNVHSNPTINIPSQQESKDVLSPSGRITYSMTVASTVLLVLLIAI